MPMLVTWKEWKGNNKKADHAYFKDQVAADKFVVGLGKEKEIFDVEIVEIPMKDVC